ncbi:PH domain-containing protein [Kordiimonas sp. SCSIO 12603]|uniref:PH domain-containing protein n=1 Tax=Kordiimonas sp. SCSIO 12603 TaxID=2829596 RepID=UPI0021054DBA|nr:PH domain-containing protein [Kordiimonas sp. SCSIO 12603]UTW58122.1 PH domain-containing protein [Kordiimonas sp. SCSIO 12603]
MVTTKLDAGKWQRLSPYAVIYYIVKFISAFVKQGVQSLAPLAAVIFTAGENRWLIIGFIAAGAVVFLLAGAVLSYLKFRFRIANDTFLIQRGVFKRKRLTLTFDRIQNVAFKEPIYFRPFGLVVLSIESAGSSSEEVGLGGIPRSLAEEIRKNVLKVKSKVHSETGTVAEDTLTAAPDSDDAQTIIKQPASELVRYGLSNNNIWVFAGIIGGSLAQVDWDEYTFAQETENLIVSLIGTSGAALTAFFISVLFFIAFILLMLSAIGAVVSNYNYHLTRHHGRFHRTKGLFERQEKSLLESKIQCLQIDQPWAARLLSRFHLYPKQVGFAKLGQEGGENDMTGAPRFLIPSVTKSFAVDFSKLLYPDFHWEKATLKPIDRMYTRKMLAWVFAPITVLPATSLSIVFSPWFMLILLFPVLAMPFVMLRRSKFGYASDGIHGIIRSGFFGQKLTVFPFFKVQTVQLTQSPAQRKKGLANLVIKMAGTSLQIPFMPLQDAKSWRDRILYEVESNNSSWM